MPAPPYPVDVISKLQALNKSGNYFNANIYTPSTSGDYRVSVYVRLQTSTPPGDTTIDVGWTDEVGGPLAISTATDQFGLGATLVVTPHIQFGNAINLSVSPPSGYSGNYDVFATIERL